MQIVQHDQIHDLVPQRAEFVQMRLRKIGFSITCKHLTIVLKRLKYVNSPLKTMEFDETSFDYRQSVSATLLYGRLSFLESSGVTLHYEENISTW